MDPHLDATAQLLCRLARVGGGDDDDLLAAAASADWRRLWELAHEHEVQPLVWSRIRSSPSLRERVPPDLAAAAERRYFATALRNRARAAELNRILRALTQAGIAVIPVKGVVIAERAYGEIGLRIFDDFDVLVPRDRLADARDAVGSLGYRPRSVPRFEELDHRFHDFQLYRTLDGEPLCVEVHWDLWNPSRFRSIVDDLWQRSTEAVIAGVPVRTLSLEDTILHLAIHRTSSGLRLRHVCDVAELARRAGGEIDWDALLARARSVEATVALHVMLSLAADLLDAPIPDAVLRATRPGRVRRAILARTCGVRAMFGGSLQPRLVVRVLELDRPTSILRSAAASAVRKGAKLSHRLRSRRLRAAIPRRG